MEAFIFKESNIPKYVPLNRAIFNKEELYPLNKNFPPSFFNFPNSYKTVLLDLSMDVEMKILIVSIGYIIAPAAQPPTIPALKLEARLEVET